MKKVRKVPTIKYILAKRRTAPLKQDVKTIWASKAPGQ